MQIQKFAILYLYVDVEEVDLAVHRDQRAGGIKEGRGVEEPLRARFTLQDGPAWHVQPQLPSPLRKSVVGPGIGSAFSPYTSSRPWQLHNSGSATNAAPAEAASRIRSSAVSTFSAFSGVEDIWTAAAVILRPFISPTSPPP